jgi:nicotinic acid mononucleotide adenylyltransferase/nicotinamide mononucleotide (NMN) deamidase PncC
MHLPDSARLIEALERVGVRLVIVSSGGGSLAISRLVTTPGASGVVVEALVPYAREAIDRLLGGPQESYCAPRTARRLAMAAWQRARQCDAAADRAVGVAVSAALRSREPKRGDHRVVVAVQTLAATLTLEVVLEKGLRTRAEEEEVAAALVLDALAAECGGAAAAGAVPLRPGETVRRDRVEAAADWRRIMAGERRVAPGSDACAGEPKAGALVFPGSFDPLHEGHRLMARIAEEVAERPVEWELSVANVDKPPLDYAEIRDRAAQFSARADGAATMPLWLTRAATFLEKLAVFPEGTFVMGADTYVRLADPRYYGGSDEAAAAAVATIAREARGLIVFGRVKDGVFQDPAHLDVPQALRDVTYFVSQREFRLDVSSTELRRAAARGDG